MKGLIEVFLKSPHSTPCISPIRNPTPSVLQIPDARRLCRLRWPFDDRSSPGLGVLRWQHNRGGKAAAKGEESGNDE
ncbi:hypothetical protein DsansV1_C21g0166461 [Dioscorea sansibarensis]